MLCVRVGGLKRVTPSWVAQLNLVSLAYWFMDDGSTQWSVSKPGTISSAALHTQGFSRAENDLLAQWLMSKGFPARVSVSKGYPYLYLPRSSAELLCAAIAPYVHNSMLYKVRREEC
jgi:hypothetical protein